MLTLFLGFAKRRAEIAAVGNGDTQKHRAVLGAYSFELLDKFLGISAACVFMSYALFTMSPETAATHNTGNLIYTLPFVCYAMFRYMLIMHRGKGGEPSRELIRDPHIMIASAGWVVTSFLLIR